MTWTTQKRIFDPEIHCQKLIDLMSQGDSIASFCAEVGIGKTTAFDWIRNHDEFKEAYEIGKALSQRYYENLAKEKTNSSLSEDEYKLRDSNMLKFVMSNRFRDDYFESKNVNLKVESLGDILNSIDDE